MNGLVKGGLALGGLVLGLGALKRALNPRPRYLSWEKPPYGEFEKKVLVVGGGFGGYTAATDLCKLVEDRDDVGVLVIARDNFFTFWPLVPGIVSSDIDARNVAQPLRRALILAGASFRRAQITGVDSERKVVKSAGGIEFPYDQLIISLGGQPNFFGIPGVEEHSLTMRGVEDAERVRNRVIERFEEVSLIRDDVPDSKLTFVVIGGGATGVEVASEIHSLVHEALAPDYPNIDPHRVRVYLLEGLPEHPPRARPGPQAGGQNEARQRAHRGHDGRDGRRDHRELRQAQGGREIPTENVIWTAGNRPNMAIKDLGLPFDERTGIPVDLTLKVDGLEDIWAIGDCAAVQDVRQEDGRIVPPTAQAAIQEGHVVARNVLKTIGGEGDLDKFEYKPLGQLVELGSDFAVNEVMGVRFSGALAAIFWRLTYLVRLNSPQSKAHVAADWLLGLLLRPAVTQTPGSADD